VFRGISEVVGLAQELVAELGDVVAPESHLGPLQAAAVNGRRSKTQY
jgi:hypothetical protein